MADPPQGQKEGEQQAIQSRPIADKTGLQIPATALAILKGRFDSHTPGILSYPHRSSGLIRNQQPGFLVPRLPDGTQVRIQRLVLPELNASKPALPFFSRQQSARHPSAPVLVFARQSPTEGVLFGNAQQVMPVSLATQLHQGHAA